MSAENDNKDEDRQEQSRSPQKKLQKSWLPDTKLVPQPDLDPPTKRAAQELQPQMKRPPIIISLGRSLIVPKTGIDIAFLKQFKSLISRRIAKGDRFVIICGGGSTRFPAHPTGFQ